MYSWPDGELKQTLDLGDTGLLPLEVSVIIFQMQTPFLQLITFFICHQWLLFVSMFTIVRQDSCTILPKIQVMLVVH